MIGQYVDFETHQVICREEDPSTDLFYLESGELLVCALHGTEVKALARISPGHFFGEISFFDGRPRTTHVVALSRGRLLQVPQSDLLQQLPGWYVAIAQSMAAKIRLLDQVLQKHNIRRGEGGQKPLSIEEQRLLYQCLKT